MAVIRLTWGDQSGTLNEKQMFEAAEALEEHVTLFEIGQMMANVENIKLAKLARGYSAILGAAGISVSPIDIRSKLVANLHAGQSVENTVKLMHDINRIYAPIWAILTDGAPVSDEDGEVEEDEKKQEAHL